MFQTNTHCYKPNKDFPLQDNRNVFQAIILTFFLKEKRIIAIWYCEI